MVEWVLFYRALQGASIVHICDHGSTDDSHLLMDLFTSRGIDGVVIEPAPQVSCRSGPRALQGFGELSAATRIACMHARAQTGFTVLLPAS